MTLETGPICQFERGPWTTHQFQANTLTDSSGLTAKVNVATKAHTKLCHMVRVENV